VRWCPRSRGVEPLTDELDGLAQRAWAEAEGALDQARLASDVTCEVEDRCLTFAERTHHLNPHSPDEAPILSAVAVVLG